MEFTANYPLHHPVYSDEILSPGYVADFATLSEAAGFFAISLTEHPAPSARWRGAGGHDALDVFTMLGYCAALTSTIRLMPYVMVPAFRSAVMGAKQIATLDVLSGGRTIIPVGTGYLRTEGDAMAMDFDRRNEMLDEAVRIWKQVWAGEPVAIAGDFVTAQEIVVRPVPTQRPHPPLWVGGNSRRARQRVAEYGVGWTPILGGEVLARTTRTAPLSEISDLAAAVGDLHRRLETAGRDPHEVAVQIQGGGGRLLTGDLAIEPYLDWLGALEEAGVTHLIVEIPPQSGQAGREAIERYGEEIISRLSK